MPEQYRTIGRFQFSSPTAHSHQQCTMWINKYDVTEFPKRPVIMSLYIYIYIQHIQSNITVLFTILCLFLRPLFWGVSCFPGLPSYPCFLRLNTCFLRRYPVLPGILRVVLCMVRGGGPLCGYEASVALYVVLNGRAV